MDIDIFYSGVEELLNSCPVALRIRSTHDRPGDVVVSHGEGGLLEVAWQRGLLTQFGPPTRRSPTTRAQSAARPTRRQPNIPSTGHSAVWRHRSRRMP